MPAFTTIILRFRDLSTPAGTTTVEQHETIIAEKGYVWWGWWHKQGEIVPEAAFRQILQEIGTSGRFEVMLFDTGKYKLYRALLTDIKWDTMLVPIPSPERAATPDYYGDTHYLAWFKLESIWDGGAESDLKEFSYVRIDDLFETRKSVFDVFYDKQISSFGELRNQDRTIWFARPVQTSDRFHEVFLYDPSKVTPSNFSEQVVQAHSSTLLWVSDPHFSTDHHDFLSVHGASRADLSESIRRDLANMDVTGIGGLLISGDLTWRGSAAEFLQAKQFIDDVKSWAKLGSSEVLVCPGNHDFAFSTEPWTKGTPATELTDASTANYRAFYQEVYQVKPLPEFACGRRMCVPNGQMVDIASLNSSFLQQVPDAFQGQGFIGGPQLENTASAMRWSRDRSRPKAFRICMLHHHVVPILHREHPDVGKAASVVYDAGALMRWIVENEVDLVLHGHMHLPSLVKEKRALDYPKQEKWHEVTIAALGSSGVVASHRPNEQNSYGIIQFLRDGVRITVRRISSDDAIPNDQRTVYSATVTYGSR
jgi:predicted phosphohydrolase